MGRIKRGGGDGGEPARSPPGRLECSPAARPCMRLRFIEVCRRPGNFGTPTWPIAKHGESASTYHGTSSGIDPLKPTALGQ